MANETIADIVAEMRRFGGRHWMHDEGQSVRMFADRIEAAWKHEKAEIEASALAAGGIVEASRHKHCNAAAMREALEKLREAYFENDEGFARIDCSIVPDFEGLIDAALAEPPKNCDLAWTQKPYEQEVKEREESAAEGENA